jgi:hypothetical protein
MKRLVLHIQVDLVLDTALRLHLNDLNSSFYSFGLKGKWICQGEVLKAQDPTVSLTNPFMESGD